ncbi:DUF1489 family protein [Rhodoligotrophos defluvii]|uniref:DUF1489 family protein n=1 Tax=Rhodoligotrophos defluvii TaxID=2561934 RepID=UPI0010C96E26|nr:DUF1489 domain-containing protein [Rhodoligotrophos defluvii]
MPLHLIKLCVGCDSIEDLAQWQAERLRRGEEVGHTTRMFPKRCEEVLAGGSLYWVIRGAIMVRQPIIGLRSLTDGDGIERCRIVLGNQLVPVRPTPRRAFQGWRYLKAEDAPADLANTADADVPDGMRRDLRELGLI